jgi:hypothetical protein
MERFVFAATLFVIALAGLVAATSSGCVLVATSPGCVLAATSPGCVLAATSYCGVLGPSGLVSPSSAPRAAAITAFSR